MNRYDGLLFVGILSGTLVSPALAQPGPVIQGAVAIDREYEIKAKYLYYLAGFINPVSATSPAGASPQTAPKRIAIVGPRNETLWRTVSDAKLQKLKLNGVVRNVEWKEFPTVEAFRAASSEPWDIIFVMQVEPATIDRHLAAINEILGNRRGILLVSDQDDQFRRNAMVNMYEDKSANRVRIQIRPKSLEDHGLESLPAFLKHEAVLVYRPGSQEAQGTLPR